MSIAPTPTPDASVVSVNVPVLTGNDNSASFFISSLIFATAPIASGVLNLSASSNGEYVNSNQLI